MAPPGDVVMRPAMVGVPAAREYVACVPVGVETSLVVMMAPLLLTTMMGEVLLLGIVAEEGLGRILLGCICCVMIFTPDSCLIWMVGLLMGEVEVPWADPMEACTGLPCGTSLPGWCWWLLGNWARIWAGVPAIVLGEGSLAVATFTAAEEPPGATVDMTTEGAEDTTEVVATVLAPEPEPGLELAGMTTVCFWLEELSIEDDTSLDMAA